MPVSFREIRDALEFVSAGGPLVIRQTKAYVNGICLEEFMAEQRHVRLFRNGRNQAVRIPVEFELPGDEAIMRRFSETRRPHPLGNENGISKSILAERKYLAPIRALADLTPAGEFALRVRPFLLELLDRGE